MKTSSKGIYITVVDKHNCLKHGHNTELAVSLNPEDGELILCSSPEPATWSDTIKKKVPEEGAKALVRGITKALQKLTKER